MNTVKIKRKIKTAYQKPNIILIKLLQFLSPLIGDRKYLKMIFPLFNGYKLNLEKPITYNEKLQWLKLNYRKPIMTKMVDKYEAKNIVSQMVGDEYVIKNYGVWDKFDDIDFNTLPNKFVLKTTHDQGGVVICTDKASFDFKKGRKKLTKHLKKNHYYLSREWPYKNVKPRIIAEEYLKDLSSEGLKDYKFYCFNGKVKVLYIASDRQSEQSLKFDFFDENYKYLDITIEGVPHANGMIPKPENFEEMIDFAEKLSKNFPHVRIDLYSINGKIYFGEFTFYSGGGFRTFTPQIWDYKFGEWLNLPCEQNS